MSFPKIFVLQNRRFVVTIYYVLVFDGENVVSLRFATLHLLRQGKYVAVYLNAVILVLYS